MLLCLNNNCDELGEYLLPQSNIQKMPKDPPYWCSTYLYKPAQWTICVKLCLTCSNVVAHWYICGWAHHLTTFALPIILVNMHKHNSPRPWSWNMQLQPDMVANQLQAEAEVGKLKCVFKLLELYISWLHFSISGHNHVFICSSMHGTVISSTIWHTAVTCSSVHQE